MSDALLATQNWVDRVVVGLELCPFAGPVVAAERLRIVCSEARTPAELLADLDAELAQLLRTPVAELETTLLVHEHVLTDFDDYNDFLDLVDALLDERGCEGVVQVASFHPAYQFEGASEEDAANWTNRSPFPMLHLLREASVEEAVENFGDTAAIPERNTLRLRGLGADALRAQLAACSDPEASGT